MSRPTRDHSFNVLLSAHERKMLTDLANHLGISSGQAIRNVIRAQYQMTYGGRPSCATGQQCLCPQLHPLPQQPQSNEPTK